jgi:hypothetical protein
VVLNGWLALDRWHRRFLHDRTADAIGAAVDLVPSAVSVAPPREGSAKRWVVGVKIAPRPLPWARHSAQFDDERHTAADPEEATWWTSPTSP